MLKQLTIYSLILFIILFFYFSNGANRIKEGQTTSQNLSNNAYMTDIDTKLDDLLNKLKTVKNTYPVSNDGSKNVLTGVLKFGRIEMNEDPTADPEIYITGDPPNQIIHLKLPKGIKGPIGCEGSKGLKGSTGDAGDLGNQGSTGLNILPSLISKRPLNSIE